MIVESIEAEYRRYKALAQAAMTQVPEELLCEPGPEGGNSVATICWHVSGNLRSRFTDFLIADGEKAWRNREEEFERRSVSREALLDQWERGWAVLFATLSGLTDASLSTPVTIRGQTMAVHEALHRSLAHVAYHVGQIVYIARERCGPSWRYLSIPPGQSDAYNRDPRFERPLGHARYVQGTGGTSS